MMGLISFSKAFLAHAKKVGVTLPELLGFSKSTIRWYPLITGKGLKDVRSVFEQSSDEDDELLRYYNEFVEGLTDAVPKARALQAAVNSRISYEFDSKNYGKSEYWARPIEVHQKMVDDCDGYSVLLTYLLRLYGVSEHEVFTAFLWAKSSNPNVTEGWHATTLLLDPTKSMVYAVEGSWYPGNSSGDLGSKDYLSTGRYDKPLWITNDKVSYNKIPWLRFIR